MAPSTTRSEFGAPPVIWTALDWWATGDPKFSLTHTSGLAEELGRTSGGLAGVPSTTLKFLKSLDKVPVFYAGILGVIIALAGVVLVMLAMLAMLGLWTDRAALG